MTAVLYLLLFRKCPVCDKFTESSKKIGLWQLPNILVINLKRFEYNEIKQSKITTVVDFPISKLCLNKYVESKQKEKPVYNLFGIIVNDTLKCPVLWSRSTMRGILRRDTTTLSARIEMTTTGTSSTTRKSTN